MIVRSANIADAERIYIIAQQNSLSKLKGKKLTHGFLVSNYTLETYKEYITKNRYFYVLENETEICAFLLAFTREEINANELVNRKILAYCNENFIVIKQICVATDYHHQGCGRQLYNYLIDEIQENLFASVVIDPMNYPSIEFHEKLGFRVAFTITPEDKMKRAVFFRSNNIVNFYDKDVVLNQYERAVDLYIHEDNLNWSKLNNFFYITGGIFAIAALWPKVDSYLTFSVFIMVLSFLGMVSSFLFRIALGSGIDYMHARKQAVVDIENVLHQLKGIRVVSRYYDEEFKNKRLKKSPTTKVMKNIPVILFALWALIFFASTILLICGSYSGFKLDRFL